MKKTMIKSTVAVLLALVTLSFTTIKKEKKEINKTQSSIKWIGKKITGQHDGTINFSSGYLEFNGKTLVGGAFVVDMNSIEVKDLQGEYKGKLEGHLKADDFFGVDKFATSTLVFKSVKGAKGVYHIMADLTIKGITVPTHLELKVNGDTATTSVKIDRTKFGIKYGSSSFFDNLKDKAIDNEFELNVALKF